MYGYAIGTLIGFFLAVMAVTTSPTYSDMKHKKEECEKSLPRDQHCVIMAVPVSKD